MKVKKIDNSLPIPEKREPFDKEKLVKLAKEVKKIFEEEKEYLAKEQKDSNYLCPEVFQLS